MKKFILTANLVALLALVPAVIVGYLHENSTNTDNKTRTEVVKDAPASNDGDMMLQLVKTF